jgi:membrane associated rhomboid family serine protease
MGMCYLLALLLSVVWYASVVAAVSPPIALCTPHRDDVPKHVGKAQDRGTTAYWVAIRGGVTTSSQRAALAARQRRQETNHFVLVNAVIYAGLLSAMAKWGVVNFVVAVNGFVYYGWQVTLLGGACFEYLLGGSRRQKNQSPTYYQPNEDDEKNPVAFMQRHFLQPLPWKKLRASPFSAFGSVFSHIDHGHIAANLSAFATFAGLPDKVLGGHAFAHLYLISSLCSSLFSSFSHECGMTSSHATSSLGASGAISGVISWVCLHTWKRGRSILISGEKVDPLMLLLLYVSGDLSGLFRSSTLWWIYKLLDEELLGGENFSSVRHEKDDGPKEGVGYAAHIGGMLGGALFFALNTLFEAAMASKLSRYGRFRHRHRHRFRKWF